MLRLASDADVHGEIIRGLRRRLPEIDLVRAQDALPEGTPDPEVLAWAAAENRVLITNDRNTMVGFAIPARGGGRTSAWPHRHHQRAVHRLGHRRHPAHRGVHARGRDQGPGRRLPALPWIESIIGKRETVTQLLSGPGDRRRSRDARTLGLSRQGPRSIDEPAGSVLA